MLKLAVVTRGYPSQERLYNHGFVHRRVIAYRALGIDARVFWLRNQKVSQVYHYDGISVLVCNAADCCKAIERMNPDALAVHAPAEDFGPVFKSYGREKRIVAWIYGSEMMPFYKVTERKEVNKKRWQSAKDKFDRRIAFWREFLPAAGPNFTLAFVSQYARKASEEALGFSIEQSVISPSPIDTELFRCIPKNLDQRLNVLSVRPFSDWRYANDISVETVLQLKLHPLFPQMEFRFFGEGHLFDEIMRPIRDLPNVSCRASSLTQEQVAAEHRNAGIFLCPSRDDAQGVARDEAMSSGLVVATNEIGPVSEFADASCAILAPPNDATKLASGIVGLLDNPSEFKAMSKAAAARVRTSIGMDSIVPQELQLLAA